MKNKHLYPVDWNDTIRPAILKRDRYQCKQCLVSHRSIGYYNENKVFVECDEFMLNWAKTQGKKILTIYLQVAHINHDKSDCREENLQAMCPKCHLNFDREFNKIIRKMPGRQQPKKF